MVNGLLLEENTHGALANSWVANAPITGPKTTRAERTTVQRSHRPYECQVCHGVRQELIDEVSKYERLAVATASETPVFVFFRRA